ncbi:alpha/beta hydrolase [Roseomonas sp. BN140053]|uniref:alpha/beta hydrolase n=1 Tax=Roseomonas sp. BN140053 TaxID=3391898 RepID=UPI0039EC91FF
MTLSRRALARLPFLAPLLAGCSPTGLANALTPGSGYALQRSIAFRPGPRGTLDLYTPDGVAPEAPLLVFFFGGGWRNGAKEDFLFAAQALTTLGCVVAVPDYRLFPEVRWPDFVGDGADAVRFLRNGPAAGRPIFLMGHSAGAFTAAALATDPRWLGLEGRNSLRGLIGLAGPYEFQPEEPEHVALFAAQPGGQARVTPPDDAALRGAPPALLLHGLTDDTVAPERSRELAAKLREAGSAVRLIEYPSVGHIGIIAALAAPVRGLGLAGAPVLGDIAAFLRENSAAPAEALPQRAGV